MRIFLWGKFILWNDGVELVIGVYLGGGMVGVNWCWGCVM